MVLFFMKKNTLTLKGDNTIMNGSAIETLLIASIGGKKVLQITECELHQTDSSKVSECCSNGITMDAAIKTLILINY